MSLTTSSRSEALTDPLEFEPTKKGFRLRRPKWSDPDDKRTHWLYLIGALLILGFVFFKRDQLTTDVLFGVAAGFAFGAGIMFANIFR